MAVLEGIIQEDDLVDSQARKYLFDALNAVFVDANPDAGEFPEILQRFVAHISVGADGIHSLEAFGFPAIAATEDGHAKFIFQQASQILGVGRFSCSAQVEVAHANQRLIETPRFQDVPIIKFMPDSQDDMID